MLGIAEEQAEKELETQESPWCQAICTAGLLLYFFLHTHRAAGHSASSQATVCDGPDVATQPGSQPPSLMVPESLLPARQAQTTVTESCLGFPRPVSSLASLCSLLCTGREGSSTDVPGSQGPLGKGVLGRQAEAILNVLFN